MNCLPCLRKKTKGKKKSDGKNEDKKEDGELPVAQPKVNPISKQPTLSKVSTVKITGSNKKYDSYKQANLGKQEQIVDIDDGVAAGSTTVAVPVVAPAATTPSEPSEAPAGTFRFHELTAATKNFNRECLLGESAYGKVYKGTLPNGKIVAVKHLDKNGFKANKEFLEEVSKLSALQHPNLVELIGYCVDGDERLLVYEYMPNGSLTDNLFGKTPSDWITRMQAASGAAQALLYLHEKVNPPVLCRNLKCTNILFDEDFEPKVSDFGLVSLESFTGNVQQRVVGTVGCAPEYERTGQLTVKSDVYSFGVILLELISGRKAMDSSRPKDQQNLVSWAQPYFKDPNRYQEVADSMFKGVVPKQNLNQAVGVAVMCLQEESNSRPLISDIVDALSFLTSPSEDVTSPPASVLDLKVEPYNPPVLSSSSSSSSSDSDSENELDLKIEPFNLPEPQPEPEPESDTDSSSSSDSDAEPEPIPVHVPVQEPVPESSSSSSSSDSDTEPVALPIIEQIAEPSQKDQSTSDDSSDDSSVVYEEDAYSEEEFSDEDKKNTSIVINSGAKPPRRKSTKKRVVVNTEGTDSKKPRQKKMNTSRSKKSFRGDQSKSKIMRKTDSRGDDQSDTDSTDESDVDQSEPQKFARFKSANSKVYKSYADESDHGSSSEGEK